MLTTWFGELEPEGNEVCDELPVIRSPTILSAPFLVDARSYSACAPDPPLPLDEGNDDE